MLTVDRFAKVAIIDVISIHITYTENSQRGPISCAEKIGSVINVIPYVQVGNVVS
jgi:hypothetical protein